MQQSSLSYSFFNHLIAVQATSSSGSFKDRLRHPPGFKLPPCAYYTF